MISLECDTGIESKRLLPAWLEPFRLEIMQIRESSPMSMVDTGKNARAKIAL